MPSAILQWSTEASQSDAESKIIHERVNRKGSEDAEELDKEGKCDGQDWQMPETMYRGMRDKYIDKRKEKKYEAPYSSQDGTRDDAKSREWYMNATGACGIK